MKGGFPAAVRPGREDEGGHERENMREMDLRPCFVSIRPFLTQVICILGAKLGWQ